MQHILGRIATLAMFTALVTACTESSAPVDIDGMQFSHKGGHGGGGGGDDGTVALIATFDDAVGDGVLSDGMGSYPAYFSEGGQFKLDAKSKSGRMLCSDYPDGAQGTQWEGTPGNAGCSNGYFSSGNDNLQAMPVGERDSTRMLVHMEGWFLQFGYECPDQGWPPDSIPADYVDVTHPDADTWILEGSNAILCHQATKKGNPPPSEVGRYPMHFRIVAVREQ